MLIIPVFSKKSWRNYCRNYERNPESFERRGKPSPEEILEYCPPNEDGIPCFIVEF